MSLNSFLIQLVLFSSVFMLVQAARLPRGWLVVTGILLSSLGIGWAIAPDWAGYISGSLWIGLFVLPLIGFARINRLVSQEKYQAARKMAHWVKWLHPADGFVEYPHLLMGLELGQQGHFAAARQLFDCYSSNGTPIGRMATVLLYRMGAQWPELVQWVERHVPETMFYRETGIATAYLRSQGELGNLNQLLQGIERFEQQAGRQTNALMLNTVRLYGLAFCGQVDLVKRLLNGRLSVYPSATRQFWLATAEMMAGRGEVARAMLIDLRHVDDRSLQHAIDWRLAVPAVDPVQVLTEPSLQILRQLKTAIAQEARYSGWGVFSARKSYITYSLIGMNLAVFGWTLHLGGIDDIDVLYKLGALVPEDVFAGQWWRSLTAMFLHAGVLHLLANMLGLYLFGAWVETALGHLKFILCYFFCGIGSMLCVAIITMLSHDPFQSMQMTVGASGAILGLVGAEAAIQLKGWRLEGAKIAKDRFQFIVLVIGFQLLTDVLTPQVSVIGHLSGMILGFMVGLVLFKPRAYSGV